MPCKRWVLGRAAVIAFVLFAPALSTPQAMQADHWSRVRMAYQCAYRSGTSFLGYVEELCVRNLDGSEPRRLGVDGQTPRISPDGTQLVFVQGPDERIAVVDLTNPRRAAVRVLTTKKRVRHPYYPAWSPDGLTIAFRGLTKKRKDGTWQPEIFVTDRAGTNVRQLTTDKGGASYPEWLPDATRISYFCGGYEGSHLCVMNADGSDQKSLMRVEHEAREFRWSPDAREIAFTCRVGPDSAICAGNADGSDFRRVAYREKHTFENPVWIPGRRMIAFTAYEARPQNEYVPTMGRRIWYVDLDTGEILQLIKEAGSNPSFAVIRP